MSYILSGDSGTVVFDRTGTITNESPTMSSQVTSNPIEGGGKSPTTPFWTRSSSPSPASSPPPQATRRWRRCGATATF